MIKVRSKLLRRGSQIPFKVFREGGKEHYNVRIQLDAEPEELTKIKSVEYQLHDSFRNPTRISNDRDSQFSIEIWTWGMFEIAVTIHLDGGRRETLTHHMKFSLPSDDGSNYVQV